jgi:uncharacterized protein YozE (UPF0346 family)
MQNFYEWLLKQDDRNDIISDLASDIKRDPNFPKNSPDIATIREYLEYEGDHVIEALEKAWREFGG